jgi:hypothetical protein
MPVSKSSKTVGYHNYDLGATMSPRIGPVANDSGVLKHNQGWDYYTGRLTNAVTYVDGDTGFGYTDTNKSVGRLSINYLNDTVFVVEVQPMATVPINDTFVSYTTTGNFVVQHRRLQQYNGFSQFAPDSLCISTSTITLYSNGYAFTGCLDETYYQLNFVAPLSSLTH